MRTFQHLSLALSLALVPSASLLGTACSKASAPGPAAPVVDPIPMTQEAPAASQLGAVLASYETVRARLAADDAHGLQAPATELAAAAKTAMTQAPAAADKLDAIATHATKLSGLHDLAAARTEFGEISRHLIGLLSADKQLAKGQHVFECPMVAGYKKWVQPNDALANPYMGQKMLACGGESTWD